MFVASKTILSWEDKKTSRVTYIRFDVVTSETNEALVAVTEHPVEDGPDVADHARPEPETITIEALVSNKPTFSNPGVEKLMSFQTVEIDIRRAKPKLTSLTRSLTSAIGDLINPPANKALVLAPTGDFPDRVREMREKFEKARLAGARFRIVTAIRELDNMMLTRVATVRTPEFGGGAVTFQLDFRQVRIVKSKTVAAPVPAEARGAVPVSKGSQATKEDKKKEEKLKSLAAAGFDGVAGGLSKLGF